MPGSWTKRGKNTYRLQVYTGANYKGEPERYTKTVHCKSDKQADRELAKFYVACESGDVSRPNNITLAAFCDTWLVDYAEVKVKKTTYARYKSDIDNRIKPTIGKKKLIDIKLIHVQQWVNAMLKEGKLSIKSIHNAFSLLRTIMETARKWEIISKNPCIDVDLKPLDKAEADYYNKEEVLALLGRLDALPEKDLQFKTGITLALFTGMRLAEIEGLKWSDVDMDKQTLKVSRVRLYVHGVGIVEDTPKTKNSIRTIALPSACINLLKALRHQQKEKRLLLAEKWANSEYVFVNCWGAAIFPRSLSKHFDSFLKKEGLRRITFHSLRHTHTSILDGLGVSEVEISKRLGHSQLSTTRNIYTHIFNESDTYASKKLDDFYTLSQNHTILTPNAKVK